MKAKIRHFLPAIHYTMRAQAFSLKLEEEAFEFNARLRIRKCIPP
jgi:hypothetical protein